MGFARVLGKAITRGILQASKESERERSRQRKAEAIRAEGQWQLKNIERQKKEADQEIKADEYKLKKQGEKKALSGTYQEQINSPGRGIATFIVSSYTWSIRFYFPGPDLRYNGTTITINGDQVQEYLNAYRENWKTFKALKAQTPIGGKPFQKFGEKGMAINVGTNGIYQNGVCLKGWHLPIDTEEKLSCLLDSLEYCIEKAPQIMQWLKIA